MQLKAKCQTLRFNFGNWEIWQPYLLLLPTSITALPPISFLSSLASTTLICFAIYFTSQLFNAIPTKLLKLDSD